MKVCIYLLEQRIFFFLPRLSFCHQWHTTHFSGGLGSVKDASVYLFCENERCVAECHKFDFSAFFFCMLIETHHVVLFAQSPF